MKTTHNTGAYEEGTRASVVLFSYYVPAFCVVFRFFFTTSNQLAQVPYFVLTVCHSHPVVSQMGFLKTLPLFIQLDFGVCAVLLHHWLKPQIDPPSIKEHPLSRRTRIWHKSRTDEDGDEDHFFYIGGPVGRRIVSCT